MAGGIAHDFKNILTAVIGASDMLLRKSEVGSDANKYGSMIRQSAERGASLAKRLLSYSRKTTEEEKVFDVNDIIIEVTNIAKYTLSNKVELHVNTTKEELNFEGDPVKIQQCLLNLAVNAKDAMDDNGEITFTSYKIQNLNELPQGFEIDDRYEYGKISVSDTGCGMSQETIDKIFEPFFTTKETGKGTGLGLSTTLEIIRSYNGLINVESAIGVGTTFNIYLPLSSKTVTEKEIETSQEDTDVSHSILLVDDEEIILSIAGDMLREFGHKVETCKKGIEALEKMKHNNDFEMIIVDRMMPEIDGVELFYKIKEINEEIAIVMASGNVDEQQIEDLKRDGLFEFISKPYKMNDLHKLISRLD